METEKTSYTLNHNGEEEKVPKSESYEPLLEDVPAETDKMLVKADAEVKKSAEVLAEADETTALDEKKDEAIKETPAVPAKNRFLSFFDRKRQPKPEPEPAETHNGNGTAPEAVDGAAEPANPPKRLFPLNLKNPFAKKVETPVPDAEEKDKPTVEASSSDEKKGELQHAKAHLTEIFIDFIFSRS